MNAKEIMGKRNGTQAGDPAKGAKAMYELAILPDPPLRVVIGTDAYAVSIPLLSLDYVGGGYWKGSLIVILGE